MRFGITGNWDNGFEQDGVLFCTQRIEEMLMNYTSHLYKTPVYIVPMAEHLHGYVDEVILDLINRLTCEKGLGSIANVIIDAQVFIDNLEKECVKEDAFSTEDIKKLLD